MRNPRTTIAIVGLIVAATAGTATIVEASAGSATPVPVSAAGHQGVGGTLRLSGTATVQAAKATVAGRSEIVLVSAKGLPLYIYKPDTATRSLVTGQLAALWPPLRAEAPSASRAAAAGTLTAVQTTNGRQVAYNGHFLYTFSEDSPGRVTGQGVQDFFVATPSLVAQSPKAPQRVAPSPASSSFGY